MIMKKIIIPIILFAGVFSLSGCEDFLTKAPENALSPATFFSTQTELDIWANGLYSDLMPSPASLAELTADDIGSAKELNDKVRTHWNVETGHNVLDNLLYEDRCTMHAGSATENCSWLRKVVFNVLSILRQIDPQIENSENGFKACAQKYCGSIPKIVKLLSNPFSALLNK